MNAIPKRGFARRVLAAMVLDVSLYEEVEADPDALVQAIGVVVAASFAQAFGVGRLGEGGSELIEAFVLDLIGWFLWAGITFLIGTRLFPGPETHATWGQLLRTTGFSAAPGLVAALIPLTTSVLLLSFILYLVIIVWTLVAFVLAVRQALDYASTWRAILVCAASWPVFFVVSVLI
jgi:hypothetical protein